MALRFSKERKLIELIRVIEFKADYFGQSIICRVGAEALLKRAGLPRADNRSLLTIFDALQYEMRAVVKRKYNARKLEGDGSIAIAVEDLNPARAEANRTL